MPTVKEALDTIPESMWDDIDAAITVVIPKRPANSFTFSEFLQHHPGMSKPAVKRTLAKLVKAGKAKMFGKGNSVYYQLVK